MATIYPTSTVPVTGKDDSFPTAAIVVLAVGGYMILFVIGLFVRKCIINNSTCPEWCSQVCQCDSCFGKNEEQPGCMTKCATSCNCCKYPSKQRFMDSFCPSKEWCDDTFCFCMSQQPQGQCCKCDDCCTGCGNFCECPECKDCCDDCKCECCAQPETIDCCCLEVKLSGAGDRNPAPPQMNQGGYMSHPGGYMNQQGNFMHQSGYFNQSGYMMNQSRIINQQPGSYMQQSSSSIPISSQPGNLRQNFSGSESFPQQGPLFGMNNTSIRGSADGYTQPQPSSGGMFQAGPSTSGN